MLNSTFFAAGRQLRRAVLVAGVTWLTTATAPAQVLSAESFQSTTTANFTLGGTAKLTAANGSDANGEGYLRLTNADAYQSGYAIANQTFPANQGFNISFELFAYGGREYGKGDGFSVFLVDGDQTTPSTFRPGAYGGSLGYAQRIGGTTVPGVAFGYLGVGFDVFGNFSNPNEGRVGGPGARPNSVAIRGAGNGATGTDYPYLNGSQYLPFPLSVPTWRAQQGSDDYRRAYVSIVPANGAYTLTVRVQYGNKIESVLSQFSIPNPPKNLRIGFAGSTGDATNIHELRKLVVAQTPFLSDQRAALRPGQTTSVSVLQGSSFTFAPFAPGSIDVDIANPGVQTSGTYPAGQVSVSNDGMLTFVANPSFTGSFTVPISAKDQTEQVSTPANVTFVVSQPLPVTLTRFSVEARQADAIVQWSTATELTNVGFAVERSLDGQQFTQVAFVPGRGNSTQPTSYSFVDAHAADLYTQEFPIYYRLRQVDTDGTMSYSAVQAIRFAAAITLYPNPVEAGAAIEIHGVANGAAIQVLTLTGQTVYEHQLKAGQQTLPNSGLARGSYLLRVNEVGKVPLTLRLVQQ